MRTPMAEHEPSIGLSSDWFTPKPIFDALGLVFDLDPAHPGRDNPHCVVPTRRIFTARDDGLRQPWHGLIWLNPPFGGRRGQVPWLRKFLEHCNGIALCAARTSADWFHELVVPNAELLLLQAALGELDLLPLQVAHLGGPQTVAVGHQAHGRMRMPIAAMLAGAVH